MGKEERQYLKRDEYNPHLGKKFEVKGSTVHKPEPDPMSISSIKKKLGCSRKTARTFYERMVEAEDTNA